MCDFYKIVIILPLRSNNSTMVDIIKLDKNLQELVLLKNKLSSIGYDNAEYDDVEEKLHDLEDSFIDEYGDYLEEVLHNVHDEYCPDNDVLLPTAYLANVYKVNPDNSFEVSSSEGVFVDADDFPGKNTRLVIIPNPLRIVLNIDSKNSEILWRSES